MVGILCSDRCFIILLLLCDGLLTDIKYSLGESTSSIPIEYVMCHVVHACLPLSWSHCHHPFCGFVGINHVKI